jgi:hypothetical protein
MQQKALKQDGFTHAEQDPITHMPRFNETISIQINVDSIYDKMLELLPDNYKHREVVAHAIIGTGIEAGNIGYVYNALCGFTNAIDFKEGDVVICVEKERRERYDANKEEEDGKIKAFEGAHDIDTYKPNWKTRMVPIGKCKIKRINLYAADKLQVEFLTDSSYSSTPEMKTAKVNHKNCTLVPETEVVATN